MARYQVILAYDGTAFFGFQRQVQGKKSRTVQAVIETALRQIGWQGEDDPGCRQNRYRGSCGWSGGRF